MQPGTSTIWQGLTPESASNIPTQSVGRILFHDSADGLLKSKDSSGDVVTIVQTDTSGVIVGPITLRNSAETATNLITLLDGELAIISDTGQLRYGDGVTAGGFAANMASQYTILCPPVGTPAENGAAYLAALAKAKTLTPQGNPLADDNRVLIKCGSGRYLFSADPPYDTDFIDTEGVGKANYNHSLGTAKYPDTIFEFSSGDFDVSCRNTRISGIQFVGGDLNLLDDVNGNDRTMLYDIGTNESVTTQNTVPVQAFISDCVIDSLFSARHVGVHCVIKRTVCTSQSLDGDTAGTFEDVVIYGGGLSLFTTASGLYIRCEVQGSAGFGSTFSGIAIECKGPNISFGYLSGTTGQLYRCQVGYLGIGATSSTTRLYDCVRETGDGTGVYEYMPENAKRKNGTDSDSQTGKDFTSTYRITWTNPGTDDLMVLNQLKLSNLNTSASTFSVAVSSTNALGCTAGASGVMTPESGFAIPSWWVAGDLVDVTWDDGGPKSRTDVEITTVGATIDLDETTGTGDALPTSGSVTVTGIGELSYNGGALTFSSTKPDTEDKWLVSVPVSLGLIGTQESLHVDIESDNAGDTSVNYTQNIIEQAVL